MKTNTDGFNLLTALVGSSPTKLGVVSLAAAKVINGAITGGKSGHRIFYSLSDCVMIFHEGEGCLLFLIAEIFYKWLDKERGWKKKEGPLG